MLFGSYYYVVEVRMAGKKELAEEAEKRLFDLEKDNIQEIRLKRFRHDLGKWIPAFTVLEVSSLIGANFGIRSAGSALGEGQSHG